MNQKFPKAVSTTSKAFRYLKEVWQETFPNEQHKTVSKMELRKQAAKMQKEMEDNQEYIDKIQEEIPEWKRGAVVVTDQTAEEERKGILSRLTKKLGSTKAAQDFMDSEQYKQIEKMRAEMQEFKSNLKEELDNT